MHLELAHEYWKRWLRVTDGAVDMTVGNGWDTLVLAGLLSEGWVVGFDVQERAIEVTRERVLGCEGRVRLVRGCHTGLKEIDLPCPPRLVVYNLGYLPGGDKSLTTMTEKTLESLEIAMDRVSAGGALSVMCYPGHAEGKRETEAVLGWVKRLNVVKTEVHPGPKTKPVFIWIEK